LTRKLTVKKEIRTLGIDLCNHRRFVGVVVRGGLYLDGVLAFPSESKPKNSSIASAILGTRFFPELRLIMTHDPERLLDARLIERLTKLQVIEVEGARKRESQGFRPYKVGRKELQAKSTLEPETLQEIFSETWVTGRLPEPLRIAHLIGGTRFP
jgi:endonuclease V-like protein UPF0215 family